MKANFRQVFAYYVDVEAQNPNAALPPLSKLIDIWDSRRQAGQAHLQVAKGDVA